MSEHVASGLGHGASREGTLEAEVVTLRKRCEEAEAARSAAEIAMEGLHAMHVDAQTVRKAAEEAETGLDTARKAREAADVDRDAALTRADELKTAQAQTEVALVRHRLWQTSCEGLLFVAVGHFIGFSHPLPAPST